MIHRTLGVLAAGALALATGSGCLYPARDLVIGSLPCTDEGECVEGFVCRANICVVAGDNVDAGPSDDDDAGPLPLDGGPPLPAPARPAGAVSGAGVTASESFRANIAVGASSAANGRAQSDAYRLTLGAQ